MPQFTLRDTFWFSFLAVIAVAAYSNPEIRQSPITSWGLSVLAATTAVLALATKGGQRAGFVGAAVCLGGTEMIRWGLRADVAFPPQMRLCGPPFGWLSMEESDWNTIQFGFGIILASIGASTARYLHHRRSRTWAPSRPGWFPFASVCLAVAALIAGLTALESRALATCLQMLANGVFCLALVGVIYGPRANRIAAAVAAMTMWLYLYAETNAAWAYSYYLGPAPYLYRFHPSHSGCWVTAHAIFAIFLAYIAYRYLGYGLVKHLGSRDASFPAEQENGGDPVPAADQVSGR